MGGSTPRMGPRIILPGYSNPSVEDLMAKGREETDRNKLSPIVIRFTLTLPATILSEAALSFLGLGSPPPTPSWGRMLNEARKFMEVSPALAIFPGLAIFITVLGFNLLGDGLRDVLDPRLS